MKKLSLALSLVSLLLISACSTISGATGAIQKPANIVADFCPIATAELPILAAGTAASSTNVKAAVTKFSSDVTALCSPATAVALANLNSIPGDLNALALVVPLLPIPQVDKTDAAIALALLQSAIAVAVQASQSATPALPSSVVVPTPAAK